MSELSDQLKATLALDPGAPELEFEERWLDWGDLAAMVKELHRLLQDFGSPKELRTGAILANRPFAIGAILNAFLDERTLVTFSAAYPDERVVEDLIASDIPVVIVAERDLKRRRLLAAATERNIRVIAAVESEGARPRFELVHAGDPTSCSHKLRNPGVGVEMMTSGTTGRPKRIPIAASSISRGVLGQMLYESGPRGARLRSGVSILTTSFAHIGGLSALLYALASGRRACVIERTSVESLLPAIRRHRPRVLRIPPAIVRSLLDAGVTKEDLSSLTALRTGTAPLDPALVDAYLEKFDLPILQNYGATEFAGGAAGWTLADFKIFWPAKRGSVGRLSPGVEGRIVNPDTGAVLAPGEDGALEVKVPYLDQGPSWLRTTDRAAIDEDGFLFLKGRLDNVINRGGFKVFPDEVQRVLETYPNIVEACVVGVPDARLGHVPVAAIVLRDKHNEPTAEALGSYIREGLAPYFAPVRYIFVESLPRTPSMKVDNGAVRALVAASDAMA